MPMFWAIFISSLGTLSFLFHLLDLVVCGCFLSLRSLPSHWRPLDRWTGPNSDMSLTASISGFENRWLASTLSAASAAKTSRAHLAPLLWQKAHAFSLQLSANDPRRAAALHNAGFAHLILGDRQTSLELFSAAHQQWQSAEAWLRSTDVPLAGHSSSFHLLLASKNSEALLRLRHGTYLRLCDGAASITTAISQYFTTNENSRNDTTKHIRALRDAFGDDCAEARTLELLESCEAPDFSEITQPSLDERWRGLFRNTPVEIRPLLDAVYLTAGLHPKHLIWLRQAANAATAGAAACKIAQRKTI
jgi:hypothetical protein